MGVDTRTLETTQNSGTSQQGFSIPSVFPIKNLPRDHNFSIKKLNSEKSYHLGGTQSKRNALEHRRTNKTELS